MRNTSLAEATAANRARAEVAKLTSVDVSAGATHAKTGGYSELSREKASCKGTTYVKLVARAVVDAH